MQTATPHRAPIERYRFNRIGGVVRDTRTMSTAYLAPVDNAYQTGDALFAPRRTSNARAKFKAARHALRAANRPAAHAARIHAATKGKA
jgi:hypothetical protein